MIPIAPITWLTAYLSTDKTWAKMRRRIPSKLGLEALAWFHNEVAQKHGETTRNNGGKHIERYKGPLNPKRLTAWCAAAVYASILYGAHKLGRAVPFSRTHGARKLFRLTAKYGHLVEREDVMPGDIVLFSRGKRGRKRDFWKAHVGIVSNVIRDESDHVEDIFYGAGNEGKFPSLMRFYRIDEWRERRLIGFARLP